MVVCAHAEPHENYMYTRQLKVKWAVQLRPIYFYHLQVVTDLQERDSSLRAYDLSRFTWNRLQIFD